MADLLSITAKKLWGVAVNDDDLRTAFLPFIPAAEQDDFQLWTRIFRQAIPQPTQTAPTKFPNILIRWISPASVGTYRNFIAVPGGLVAMGGQRVTVGNRWRISTAINKRNTDSLSDIVSRLQVLFTNTPINPAFTGPNGEKISCTWEADYIGSSPDDGITYTESGAFYITETVAL